MRKKIELLLPVGGTKQLIAAVENGADAVYLGGQSFNARQYADNFNYDELKKSIKYAHIRGVNVYLTMNTLISDYELQEALKEVAKAYTLGIDALIVQDIGFAQKVKEFIPDLQIHMSTQGTIYNLEGVKILESMNFNRVILARELDIKEITSIGQLTNMEIEVFVHGALCIGYSGQCLLSSLIGGRSGNRGKCAQPCRLPYQITDLQGNVLTEKSYLMSPKDLAAINLLPQLIKGNVKSLKVEGRMKSPEYVAAITQIYRKYLDLALMEKNEQISKEEHQILMQVYNRNGFTTAYLEGRKGYELISRQSPKHWGVLVGEVVSYNKRKKLMEVKLYESLANGDGIEVRNEHLPGNIVTYMEHNGNQVNEAQKSDVVSVGEIKGAVYKGDKIYKITDKKLNKKLQESFINNKFIKKIPIKGIITAKIGQPIQLIITDYDGNKVTVQSNKTVEEAIKKAITQEEILKQINKTGSTPFKYETCMVKMDENISIPLSEINALRREGLNRLEETLSNKYPQRKRPSIEIKRTNIKKIIKKPVLSVFLWNANQLEHVYNESVSRLYIPIHQWMQSDVRARVRKLKKNETEIMMWLPPITRGYYDQWLSNDNVQNELEGLDGILIGNLSHIQILRHIDIPLYGDYSLNVYNSETINVYKQLGLKGVALSHELTLQQIKDMESSEMGIEVAIYGRLPLMISEHCPVGSELGRKTQPCRLCHSPYFLSDRKNKKFPLLLDSKNCRSTILNSDKLWVPDLMQSLLETEVSTFRLYFYDESPKEITKIIKVCKDALNHLPLDIKRGEGYTKGHYFRGI